MSFSPFSFARKGPNSLCQSARRCLRPWTKPDTHSLIPSATLDLTRSKQGLLLENMLLRQQLIVLKRQAKRPALTWRDRALFVFWASKLPHWKEALVIVQPDTVLRWHRDLFRRYSKRKSKPKRRKPRIAQETVDLIRQMAF